MNLSFRYLNETLFIHKVELLSYEQAVGNYNQREFATTMYRSKEPTHKSHSFRLFWSHCMLIIHHEEPFYKDNSMGNPIWLFIYTFMVHFIESTHIIYKLFWNQSTLVSSGTNSSPQVICSVN